MFTPKNVRKTQCPNCNSFNTKVNTPFLGYGTFLLLCSFILLASTDIISNSYTGDFEGVSIVGFFLFILGFSFVFFGMVLRKKNKGKEFECNSCKKEFYSKKK
jgi:hypothetical protein